MTSIKTYKTRIPNNRRSEILDELTKMVENGQTLGVTQQQLATKFNVKRETVKRYLDKVYQSIPPEDIKSIQVKLETMFNKLFREAQKMIQTAANQRERKEAMDLLLRCMDKFTDFLERFGIKAKAEENINLKADITQRSINIQIIDDRTQLAKVMEE